MLPAVTHVLSVEMVRDGGSLVAIWNGGDGVEYWLLYPVIVESVGPDHNRITGWDEPQVHARDTGAIHELSWQHAKILIDQFRPFAASARFLEILDAMKEIATNRGDITPAARTAFPTVGESRRVFRPHGA